MTDVDHERPRLDRAGLEQLLAGLTAVRGGDFSTRLALTGGSLWLLDEPGSNLDATGQHLLLQLIVEHLRAGGAAVVATHRGLDLPVTQLRSLSLQ